MEHDVLRDRLRDVMASVFETGPYALPEAADTDNVEKWDSLGHLMLIESVEETFGVSFDHAETIEMLSEDAVLTRLVAHIAETPLLAEIA